MEKLNLKKIELLDSIDLKLDMKIDGNKLKVEETADILGAVTETVANIKTSTENSIKLPPSLKSFEVAIILADLMSLDGRENKEPFILHTELGV